MEALMESLQERIKGKRVLILGFGREGRSTLKRILQAGGAAEIAIADQREIADAAKLQEEVEKAGRARTVRVSEEGQPYQADEIKQSANTEVPRLRFLTGEGYQSQIQDYDLVFRSPGIVLEHDPDYYQTTITSEAEVFLQVYRKQVIGITGTKGKSTTTTLLYHILKENGIPAVLMGNIGIPAFDCLDELTPETVVVFEFSCHQLEYNTCSPHRAVYLNLFEEHLDHYRTFERYQAAKENIYRHQEPEDVLYCGIQVLPEPGSCVAQIKVAYPYGEYPKTEEKEKGQNIGQESTRMTAETSVADIWLEDHVIHYCRNTADEKNDTNICNYSTDHRQNLLKEEICLVPEERVHLLGHHNLYDIAIVYAVARDMGVTQEGFLGALPSYQPLPHRLEYIGTVQGIRFYDDSISTIGETTIQALDTLPDTGTVLIGGMDRGIEYHDLIQYLAEHPVEHVILMEATGKRIGKEINQKEPELAESGRVYLVEHLEEAVELAFQITKPGMACVLSPAAASYGIFKDFEERGRRFQELVKRGHGTP